MENNIVMKTNILDKSVFSRITDLPGLAFRNFRGEEDYPRMLKVIHGSKGVDGIERAENLEDIVNNYTHLNHCDPYQDMLFAEINGEVVGYSRVWWSGRQWNWIGFQFGMCCLSGGHGHRVLTSVSMKSGCSKLPQQKRGEPH
jgi:hypothetical protein